MKVLYSGKAKSSIREIYNFIKKDNEKYAILQTEKIRKTIKLLEKNPYIGVIGRVENTREFFIPSTHYFIVYTIDKNTLHIVNIIHTARNY
jgi:toxin ParE1/3/4